jgi:hypothetical protein
MLNIFKTRTSPTSSQKCLKKNIYNLVLNCRRAKKLCNEFPTISWFPKGYFYISLPELEHRSSGEFTIFYCILERKRTQMKISEKGGREPFPRENKDIREGKEMKKPGQ